jgi:outer membrane protein TolC
MNAVSIRREYEELSGEIDDLKTLIEIERLNIEKGIREAYIEVINAGRKVKEMEQLVDLQKSSLEKINARYERGLVPKTVADQVQLSCEELELGYLAALFDCNTKLMKLENAAGIGPAYQEG